MNDIADVGLVYSHAERVGRHHDRRVVVDERVLVAHALRVVKPGMIARRLHTRVKQGLMDLLDVLARRAVDDPRLTVMRERRSAR